MNPGFEEDGVMSFLGVFEHTLPRLSRSVSGSRKNKDSQMNKMAESKRPRQSKRRKSKKKGCKKEDFPGDGMSLHEMAWAVGPYRCHPYLLPRAGLPNRRF
ncbi:unnamed protein product [Prunus brigantina]